MIDEATRIRVIRSIIGWDMKRMATQLDVNPNTITSWERGRQVPNNKSRKVLAKICQEHNIAIRPDGMPVPVE